jgi:hypothetical protein
MFEWFLSQTEANECFLEGVMFSDEANFYVNFRYWSTENPHWFSGSKEQGTERIMVWCGLWDTRVIRSFFFETTADGEKYLGMLGNQMIPDLHEIGGRPQWFKQDEAPPHITQFKCVIGWTTCFLTDGLGGDDQWSGHHDLLTSTRWTLPFGDS